MYWTDWGTTPKIARGRLNNDYNVDTIVTGRLKWPNGLVIDAASQKLFWADAGMDKIEYSNLDVRLRANGLNNSQHCWRNNGGSCCVRVGSGVQTDATTPNNIGTSGASWEGYNPSLCKPCVTIVRKRTQQLSTLLRQ